MKNVIPEYRSKCGFTQDQLADRLGVSRQTINSIERGKFNPSLPLAIRIAKIFQTNVESIFFPEKDD